MKSAQEIKPSFAPVYAAAMYPDLYEICLKHGYALAVHGSLARDLDVIAIPWVENVSTHKEVLDEIVTTYAVTLVGEPGMKPHGRVAYTLACGWGACAIDFQFMPSEEQRESFP